MKEPLNRRVRALLALLDETGEEAPAREILRVMNRYGQDAYAALADLGFVTLSERTTPERMERFVALTETGALEVSLLKTRPIGPA